MLVRLAAVGGKTAISGYGGSADDGEVCRGTRTGWADAPVVHRWYLWWVLVTLKCHRRPDRHHFHHVRQMLLQMHVVRDQRPGRLVIACESKNLTINDGVKVIFSKNVNFSRGSSVVHNTPSIMTHSWISIIL